MFSIQYYSLIIHIYITYWWNKMYLLNEWLWVKLIIELVTNELWNKWTRVKDKYSPQDQIALSCPLALEDLSLWAVGRTETASQPQGHARTRHSRLIILNNARFALKALKALQLLFVMTFFFSTDEHNTWLHQCFKINVVRILKRYMQTCGQ